ncbi:MAG: hypothetical protein QOJ41_1233 [Acidobacteriaceae bacterium]|jgi:hypothetical protein|nr:hypothetical protein [Acidobacteriaceae bacterium]
MMHPQAWAWVTLFLMGAYHGINPAMGWLFAVALGLQKKSGCAVWESLLPIATGHVVAIAAVILVAVLAGAVVPVHVLRIAVVVILVGFGVYRIVSKSHPRFGGMQVGFRDLTIWSFLMACAHGAGLMLLPVLLGMSAMGAGHETHVTAFPSMKMQLVAIAIHTLGYSLLTGTIAWVVFKKLGVSVLRKAWLNLDFVWAIALIATAGLTLVFSWF